MVDTAAPSVIIKNNVANMKNHGEIFPWLNDYIITLIFCCQLIKVNFFPRKQDTCIFKCDNKQIHLQFTNLQRAREMWLILNC